MPVLQVNGKNVFYPDPKSAIWLLGIDQNGAARTYIVSLVAQNNYFFLTFCETFAEQCFRDTNGKVVCPGMKKDWAPMAEKVEELLCQAAEINLPPVSEYKPKQEEASAPGTARIDWFTIRLGIGEATTTRDGKTVTARVHWTQQRTDRGDGLKYFLPGETVRFGQLVARTGPHHKETPEYELKDVFLL